MSMTLTDKIHRWFIYHPKTTIAVTYLLAFVGPYYTFLLDVVSDVKDRAQELKKDGPEYYENLPKILKNLPEETRKACSDARKYYEKERN